VLAFAVGAALVALTLFSAVRATILPRGAPSRVNRVVTRSVRWLFRLRAGVPVLQDREEAWTAWRGWRVNYDAVLLNLARLLEAPVAPWVADRSPISASPRRRVIRGGVERPDV
jgi:hypothetical protein